MDTANKLPILVLAPMAGITDLPFRLICKQFGADIVYSEMVSAAGLFFDSEKTFDLMKTLPEEAPMILQLFGNESDHFKKSVEIINTLPDDQKPAGIDINFGCPEKKIIKQGSGCALMQESKKAREIIQATIENSDLPISIKIRAGIKNFKAVDFLKEVGDLGWKTLMIHGRTFEEGFSGPIDLELVKKAKKMFPEKNIYANGGIFTPEIAQEVFAKTSADGLGIARGALGNPWIFRQIKDFLETRNYSQPSQEDLLETAARHLDLFKKHKPKANPAEMKKHLFWYLKGFENAKALRGKIMTAESLDEMKDILKV